jgi:hypothetical protein
MICDFNEYFATNIMTNNSAEINVPVIDSDKELKRVYDEEIDKFAQKFDKENLRRLYSMTGQCSNVNNHVEANLFIRKEINDEFLKLLDDISLKLAGHFTNYLEMTLKKIGNLLYKIPEIQSQMLHDKIQEKFLEIITTNSDNKEKTKTNFEIIKNIYINKTATLFDAIIKRFSRPVIQIFIQNHEDKDVKENLFKIFTTSLEPIKNTQTSEKNNVSQNTKSKSNGNNSNDEKDFKDINTYFNTSNLKTAKNKNDVLDELMESISNLQKIMKVNIYQCSGILEFYNQELDEIKRRFVSHHSCEKWKNLVSFFTLNSLRF